MASAVCWLSPVIMTTSKPMRVQLGDRFLRAIFDRIGHGDHALQRCRPPPPAWRSWPRLAGARPRLPGRSARCRAACIMRRLPTSTCAPIHLGLARRARLRPGKPCGVAQRQPALAGFGHRWPRPAGARCPSPPRPPGAAAHLPSIRRLQLPMTTSVTAGWPRVMVPVLSSTTVVTLPGALQRFAGLEQDAQLRALARCPP